MVLCLMYLYEQNEKSRKPASLEAWLEVFLLERPKGVAWVPIPASVFSLFRVLFLEPRLLRKPYFLQGKTNILRSILGPKTEGCGGPFFQVFRYFRVHFWGPRLLRKPYFLQGKIKIFRSILGPRTGSSGEPFFHVFL